MRVRFLGEDGQRITYWEGSGTQNILQHIKEIMENGFKVGEKTFKFLHYSNSQIKSHSCWFMNEIKDHLLYDTFILSLGNFQKERSAYKGIARRGQAFRSTISTETLQISPEIEEINDIERNGYTYSDG